MRDRGVVGHDLARARRRASRRPRRFCSLDACAFGLEPLLERLVLLDRARPAGRRTSRSGGASGCSPSRSLALVIAVIAASSRLLPAFMYASTAAALHGLVRDVEVVLRAPHLRAQLREAALQHLPAALHDRRAAPCCGATTALCGEEVLVRLRRAARAAAARVDRQARTRAAAGPTWGRSWSWWSAAWWSSSTVGAAGFVVARSCRLGDRGRGRRPRSRSGRQRARRHPGGLRTSLLQSASRHRIFRRFLAFPAARPGISQPLCSANSAGLRSRAGPCRPGCRRAARAPARRGCSS